MNTQILATESKAPFFTRCGVWFVLFIHVMRGVLTLSFFFPLVGEQKKQAYIQQWSKKLLTIFNIELKTQGAELLPNSPYLLASNHISWLDIHVINAFQPIRFVAKSEVASWPVFGWMAKQLRTVFIRRDSSRHARQVVGQVAGVLKMESICIFPEGTSTAGDEVLPFKSNLFEAALVAGAPIFPLAIQYFSTVTGQKSYSPAFTGDMGLIESMAKIIQNRYLEVELCFLPSMEPFIDAQPDRKLLALYSQEAIARTLHALRV